MNPRLKRLYDKSPVGLQNMILSAYSALLHRERYGGQFKFYQNLMNQSQWYSEQELEAYQNRMLNKLMRHAYETVPYYQRIFDEQKLKPFDIKTHHDLEKIPLLTREDIKRNFHDLVSKTYNPRRLKTGHTSGTTGAPLEVCYDDSVIWATYAALDRQYQWANCKLAYNGDRVVVARGNVIVPLSQKAPPYWRYNRFHNQMLLSTFHMSKTNLDAYFDELRNFQPSVLDGYPSTLYILAKYLKNRNQKFPLKAVISSSETLFDFQREIIEDSFQCRLFDYYALAERVIFTTECEQHDGHHLCMEYGCAEILDQDNHRLEKGQVGKLVGTSLHNYAMPLIRYLTNDMTSILTETCTCGRMLQLVSDVTTKAEDTLTLKDGRLISPSVLTHPFKPLNNIEGSQIVQKEYDRIIIKIVRRPEYSEDDTLHLKREFKGRLGNDVQIDIEFIDQLPRSINGKFRWVISEVPLGI